MIKRLLAIAAIAASILAAGAGVASATGEMTHNSVGTSFMTHN